ncbi:HNH endonuclease [Candidatus Poribacteria bacterium]|nr:HNH endonuclease [Candidatus Poribacteria bacterium]
MDEQRREQVRKRYASRCGYCGVHEVDVGSTLTIDHHRPRRHGGTDDNENVVYCCTRCNQHKGAYWHEVHAPHIRFTRLMIRWTCIFSKSKTVNSLDRRLKGYFTSIGCI